MAPLFTLDDETVLASARADPAGLTRELDVAAIDEVQRSPDLLRAIKRSVDEDRRPGRFLLTGLGKHPRHADYGRIEVIFDQFDFRRAQHLWEIMFKTKAFEYSISSFGLLLLLGFVLSLSFERFQKSR